MGTFFLVKNLATLGLMIAGLIVVIRWPRAKGRELMLASIALSAFSVVAWMLWGLLPRFDVFIPFDSPRGRLFHVFQALSDAVSWGLLLGFVAVWASQLRAQASRDGAAIAAGTAAPAIKQAGGEMTVGRILFSFTGRIGRATFWGIWITMFLINSVVGVILQAVADEKPMMGLLGLVWLPFAVWIGLAMQVKRWHDRDKSGWMVLINFIPIVGMIWALVELGFLKGTAGSNQYGDDPIAPSPSGGA